MYASPDVKQEAFSLSPYVWVKEWSYMASRYIVQWLMARETRSDAERDAGKCLNGHCWTCPVGDAYMLVGVKRVVRIGPLPTGTARGSLDTCPLSPFPTTPRMHRSKTLLPTLSVSKCTPPAACTLVRLKILDSTSTSSRRLVSR